MNIHFDLSGKSRKELVQAIALHTGMISKYQGMPSCAYAIGKYLLDKNGVLQDDEPSISQELESLLDYLNGLDYAFEIDVTEAKEESERPDAIESLVISVTRTTLDATALRNLRLILDAKGDVIKKALQIESLKVVVTEEQVSFPWFYSILEPEEVSAYTNFISALCEMARNQKRVNFNKNRLPNDKYTFRCFLLRLGFIGDKYKTDRQVLLKNLCGSASAREVTEDEN